MPESDKQKADPTSKTQRKRDMLALQELGKALIDLQANQLAQIDLPDTLLRAIHLAHTLKTHESIRRHLQYVGKLMRHVDCEAIKATIEKIQRRKVEVINRFHEVEEWRDKLIAEGDAIVPSFLAAYPECDRKKLRQLIRKAQHDKVTQKNTGGETQLFRYLRELLGTP